MDETLEQKLVRVAALIVDATLRVSNLLDEENPTAADQDAVHEKVAAASSAYREVLESVPADQRDAVERAQGRRAADLRILAAQLPRRALHVHASCSGEGAPPRQFAARLNR